MFVRLFFLILFIVSAHFASPNAATAENSNASSPLFDTPDFILDPGGEVTDLAYSPDNSILASAAGKVVALWDVATGKQLRNITATDTVRRLEFTSNGLRLRVLVGRREVHTWEMTGQGGQVNKFDFDIVDFDNAPAPDDNTIAVLFAPINATQSETISLIGLNGGGEPRDLSLDTVLPDNWSLSSIAFDPTGRYSAVGVHQPPLGISPSDVSESASVYIWDLSRDKPPRVFTTGNLEQISRLQFSPDGASLFGGSFSLAAWNFKNGEIAFRVLDGSYEGGLALGGVFVASAHQAFFRENERDNARTIVILRNWKTGESLVAFRRAGSTLTGGFAGDAGIQVERIPLAINSNGTQMATVDPSGIVSLWMLKIPPEIQEKNGVNVVAYCDSLRQRPASITSNQPVTIVWSWFARTIPLVMAHWYAATYEIKLDGQVIRATGKSPIKRDPTNDNHWTLYFRAYVGTLKPGPHVVTYNVRWKTQISDGFTAFGPGTTQESNTGQCQFTVK